MKYVALVIALLSFQVVASHEVGVKYLRVNQNLFDTISFPMDAAQVSYSYVHSSNFGIRLSGARSTETANSLYVEGKHYSNKINSMFSGEVFYRNELSDHYSYEIGIGKTDYKSTWKVNEVKPTWSDGTDSDWSYFAAINYKLEDNVYLTFSYHDWYRKHKEDKGRETTRGFGAGFIYLF